MTPCIDVNITCPVCGGLTTGELCIGGRLPAGAKKHLEETLSRESLCGECRATNWPASVSPEELMRIVELLIRSCFENLAMASETSDPRTRRAATCNLIDDMEALEAVVVHDGAAIPPELMTQLDKARATKEHLERISKAVDPLLPDGCQRVTQISRIVEEPPKPGAR